MVSPAMLLLAAGLSLGFLFCESSAFVLTPSSSSSSFFEGSLTVANPNKNKNLLLLRSSIATDQDAAVPVTTKKRKEASKTSTITKSKELEPSRRAQTRKRWGIDKSSEEEYWFDHRIHSLGNVGIGGGLHAFVAPMATKRIDDVAYGGVDMRFSVAKELSNLVKTQKARVLDMCCGVGMSTRALRKAFPNAEEVMGLDTSPQMVAMANFCTGHLAWLQRFQQWAQSVFSKVQEKANAFAFSNLNFIKANAQDTKLPSKSFDLVTVMYAFHEAPHKGRFNIAQEAWRLLSPGGLLAVIDITTDYTPSSAMLAGEPYVLEYQQNIHRQLRNMKGFALQGYKVLVPGHLGMWTLKRQAA